MVGGVNGQSGAPAHVPVVWVYSTMTDNATHLCKWSRRGVASQGKSLHTMCPSSTVRMCS